MSCTIKLPTKNIDKSNEIKWVHRSSDDLFHWKNGRIKINTLGAKMEEDGSLTFESVKRRTPANIHTLLLMLKEHRLILETRKL